MFVYNSFLQYQEDKFFTSFRLHFTKLISKILIYFFIFMELTMELTFKQHFVHRGIKVFNKRYCIVLKFQSLC